ncbi:hypothetical protein [Streptomyces ardesiacus]|uniref:hypothetical protein n=1 Tax=Streptomyces ardesiacus TaxID=285564 RepID=UPI003647C6BF
MPRSPQPLVTALTPAEQRVLEQISLGLDPGAGAIALGIARGTFNRHSTQIGVKLQVKGAPAKVQMGFVSGALPQPDALPAPVDFDTRERLLWRAIALHSSTAAIATHVKVERFDLPGDTARLLDKAGASNEAHLVRLGHAYGVLTTEDVPPPYAA